MFGTCNRIHIIIFTTTKTTTVVREASKRRGLCGEIEGVGPHSNLLLLASEAQVNDSNNIYVHG